MRRAALWRVLCNVSPKAVAIPGWALPEARTAARWCRFNERIAILMSESKFDDGPRAWPKECIKRQLVKAFDAAVVGGKRHAEYLAQLGMDIDSIFLGYDVVDNAHFARGAASARANEASLRRDLNLPRNYFLASARFVGKKNLEGLVSEFATYKMRAGQDAWGLVILGDGPLRGAIEAAVRRHGLGAAVTLPGFVQYNDLPTYYGLAKAFILPSLVEQWGLVVNEAMASGLPTIVSNVSGVSELVEDGRNGCTFEAANRGELSSKIFEVSSQPAKCGRMGRAAESTIARWGPEAFGTGLLAALDRGAVASATRKHRESLNLALWM
jgi:glycosyltransferase involved in cell wall biosynthesis